MSDVKKVPPQAPKIGDLWHSPNGGFVYLGVEMGWVDTELEDEITIRQLAEIADRQGRKYRNAMDDLRKVRVRHDDLTANYGELMKKYLELAKKHGE